MLERIRNFKMSYYMKQRLLHYLVHVIMLAFLVVSLFPIGWMFFNSLKDNNEILSGRIPLNRASNDCAVLSVDGGSLLAFSANGGVTRFSRENLKKEGHFSVKAHAVSFRPDGRHIWISTAEKGLIKVDPEKLKVVESYRYPLHGVDLSKIASTVTYADADSVWTAIEYKGVQKILEFNKSTGNFKRLIDFETRLSPFVVREMIRAGDDMWLAGNKGLIEISLKEGAVKDVFTFRTNGSFAQLTSMARAADSLYLGSSSGAFIFSLGEKRMTGSIRGLLSDQINSVSVNGDLVFFGTNSGLSILNRRTGRLGSAEKLFASLDNGAPDREKLTAGEVFSIAYAPGEVYVGTTRGRISVLDIRRNSVVSSGELDEGHVIVRWRNYIDMWKNIDFGLYMRNSLIICGIATFLAMILATLAAYSLSRFRFPGSKQFSLGILATQMIPAIMYLIPIYITFVKITEFTGIQLKGTFGGIIFVYAAFFVPFSVWILRGFFAAIPVALEEAARIDGCSPFQVFWYVVLPLAVPGIIATGVYIFLTAWDELMFAWVLTNADTMTIPVGIRNFVGNYQNRFDLMMAAASVATFPVLILFFMLQKYIVKGLTAGAVKG